MKQGLAERQPGEALIDRRTRHLPQPDFSTHVRLVLSRAGIFVSECLWGSPAGRIGPEDARPAETTRGLTGMLSRGKTPILEVDGQRVKVCACKALFPVEYNSRGQMTSRALCDKCREKRARRHSDDLPDT